MKIVFWQSNDVNPANEVNQLWFTSLAGFTSMLSKSIHVIVANNKNVLRINKDNLCCNFIVFFTITTEIHEVILKKYFQ